VPPEVAAVVERALSKNAADRFASMEDVVTALEPFTAHSLRPSSAPGKAASSPPGAGRPRSGVPASLATTDFRRYSNDQIQAIMGRALERGASGATGIGHAELLEVAREVGIDERAVRKAADDLAMAERFARDADEERQRAKQKLLRNLATAVVVIGFLAVAFHAAWIKWIACAWGFSLALQAVNYFFPKDPKRGKRASRGARDPAFESVVEEGTRALLTATETRARMRVAPGPRLRVSSPGSTEGAEAEASAEADASTPPARRA
jgi:hypothetical protein